VWERKYHVSSLRVADKIGSLQVVHLSFPMGESSLIQHIRFNKLGRGANDRYANAAIGPVNAILKGYIYPDAFKGAKGTQNSSLISSMAFAGIIIGQLCTSPSRSCLMY
jgi:hypothetical protein